MKLQVSHRIIFLFFVICLTLFVGAEGNENEVGSSGHLEDETEDKSEYTERSTELHDLCGFGGSGGKIVNGTDATPGEFPWMAGIFLRSRGIPKLFCGGSLIDDQHVLTAAHCVNQIFHNPKSKDLLVRLNDFNIDTDDEGLETLQVNVEKITVHPNWKEREFRDDLAILRLDRKIEFSPSVLPICLPPKADDYVNKVATVTGWGVTKEGGKGSSTLKKASVTVDTNDECVRKYNKAVDFEILGSNICASNPPRDACQNDSGGPLQVQGKDKRWVQVGIVSWGIGCGDEKFPGVYARVSSYVDWIGEVTAANNQ